MAGPSFVSQGHLTTVSCGATRYTARSTNCYKLSALGKGSASRVSVVATHGACLQVFRRGLQCIRALKHLGPTQRYGLDVLAVHLRRRLIESPCIAVVPEHVLNIPVCKARRTALQPLYLPTLLSHRCHPARTATLGLDLPFDDVLHE